MALLMALLAPPAPAFGVIDHTTPTVPQSLRVTGAGFDYVSLAWEPAAGSVVYYQIFRNGQWVNSAYGTTITLRGLSAGTTYNIEVRARDSNGNPSTPAALTATTQADAGAPTAPANLRIVTNASGAPVGLAWDSSTDDRGVGIYWLFADGDPVFAGGPGVSFLTLTDELCTVVGGQAYTFNVRAQDLTGLLSAPSGPVTITVR